MLEDEFEIDKLKRSKATDFIAEVFYKELEFILGRELDDVLMVRKYGMNSRVMSKDVLDVTTKYMNTIHNYKEFLVLHLGQNGIYHQLPEMLIHPPVLSSPTMSNREVVEAIRENKKIEKRNIEFFLPFDTELFKEKAKIINRHLSFLTDKKSKENLFRIAIKVLDINLDIPQEALYKLFLNLCEAEKYKENFSAIEELIFIVLGLDVKIKYEDKYFESLPYLSLSEGQLGINLGLVGKTKSEESDIQATIMLSEPINNYLELIKNIDSVKKVLGFFVKANRDIRVKYEIRGERNFVLGVMNLGYDTYL